MAKSSDDNTRELIEIMNSNENELKFEAMMKARKARMSTDTGAI